ncbi:hypothetical protein OPV22_007618 [Ensete ventricosum]|uniref:Uncharacterized protein n=1 Tax=Ensete ventricosum TaxID=4639 RepID=A0AAV8RNW6_ENSVE|nr:hypothetical protein OPV22_007618 [Ensete ventricosum]
MNNHPTALPVPKETKIVMAITPGQVFAFPELSRPLHTCHPKLRTATSSPPPLRLPQAAEATAPHVIPSFTLPPGPPSPSLEFDGMIFDPHEDSPLLLISRSGACRSFVALAKTNIEKQEEREERRRRGSSLPNVDGGRSWSEMGRWKPKPPALNCCRTSFLADCQQHSIPRLVFTVRWNQFPVVTRRSIWLTSNN